MLAFPFGSQTAVARAQSQALTETTPLTVPHRRSPDTPPSPPPILPAGADRISPATITLVIRREANPGRPETTRRVVSRTSERIHVGNNDTEWLFERNPVDTRRVSATMVDHRSQSIVLYDETDLRMTMGVHGWADVFGLGFDHRVLDRYARKRGVRSIGGVRFERYVSIERRVSDTDVWWNEQQGLAGSFSVVDDTGSARVAIERLHSSVDVSVLQPAIVRFPKYRVFDLANWREKH